MEFKSNNLPRPAATPFKGGMKKDMPIIKYNPKLKTIARNLRNNSTLSEVLLWRRLKNKQIKGYKFERQRPIDNYIVDFFCKELMFAIEIDGAKIYLADDLGFGEEKAPRRGLGRVEIYLELDSKESFDRIWEKASKRRGFKVLMPAEFTFWGSHFARFLDTKKIGWQISYTPPQKK